MKAKLIRAWGTAVVMKATSTDRPVFVSRAVTLRGGAVGEYTFPHRAHLRDAELTGVKEIVRLRGTGVKMAKDLPVRKLKEIHLDEASESET